MPAIGGFCGLPWASTLATAMCPFSYGCPHCLGQPTSAGKAWPTPPRIGAKCQQGSVDMTARYDELGPVAIRCAAS